MPKYKRGDVVLAFFRFEENPSETKRRPVVIIEPYDDSCFSCMVTSTDRSDTNRGISVKKDSEEALQMGLRVDSFINAERTDIVKNIMIQGKIGTCPFMDELEEMV